MCAFDGSCHIFGYLGSFLYISRHSEFPEALMDVYRNNNVLFNGVIYKEGTKRSEKCNRLSQPELSFLPVFLYMPACFPSLLCLDP